MEQRFTGIGEVFRPYGGASLGKCSYDLILEVTPGIGDFTGSIAPFTPLTVRQLFALSQQGGKSSDLLQLQMADERWIDFIVLTLDGDVRVSGLRDER